MVVLISLLPPSLPSFVFIISRDRLTSGMIRDVIISDINYLYIGSKCWNSPLELTNF